MLAIKAVLSFVGPIAIGLALNKGSVGAFLGGEFSIVGVCLTLVAVGSSIFFAQKRRWFEVTFTTVCLLLGVVVAVVTAYSQ